MVDISRFRGIGQFGETYRVMLDNDTHAPGSVDRVLAQRMIRLCVETAPFLSSDYTPLTVMYEKGMRPGLDAILGEVSREQDEEKVKVIAELCSHLRDKVEDQSLDDMIVGGLEEEIIQRGSDWCPDVARVSCVLCQVAGIPARIILLFDTDSAYSGHTIIEAYRHGVWGAVDPLTNVIYTDSSGRPVSTWELMNQRELVMINRLPTGTPYTTPAQFKAAGITNYFVWDINQYDYTTSPINEYYRSILEMSEKGWPGGLRWIHEEDA